MSRSGKVREGEKHTGKLENVRYVAGNVLKPESFENVLQDVDAVVHAVGGLFPTKKPGRSLQELNADSCINVSRVLQQYASEDKSQRNFVMISSERAPFFLPEYLTTKEQAENFLLEECPDLKVTIIKPGVVVDQEHRWWSIPTQKGNDLFYNWCEFKKKFLPKSFTDSYEFIVPAPSTQLSTISHFTLLGIKGQNDVQKIRPQEYLKFENRL